MPIHRKLTVRVISVKDFLNTKKKEKKVNLDAFILHYLNAYMARYNHITWAIDFIFIKFQKI